jgi:hypothetical protein
VAAESAVESNSPLPDEEEATIGDIVWSFLRREKEGGRRVTRACEARTLCYSSYG